MHVSTFVPCHLSQKFATPDSAVNTHSNPDTGKGGWSGARAPEGLVAGVKVLEVGGAEGREDGDAGDEERDGGREQRVAPRPRRVQQRARDRHACAQRLTPIRTLSITPPCVLPLGCSPVTPWHEACAFLCNSRTRGTNQCKPSPSALPQRPLLWALQCHGPLAHKMQHHTTQGAVCIDGRSAGRQRRAPMMPGRAPVVLVRPSRKGAWRGDRSAWLQYSPTVLKLAHPSAAVTRAAQQKHATG